MKNEHNNRTERWVKKTPHPTRTVTLPLCQFPLLFPYQSRRKQRSSIRAVYLLKKRGEKKERKTLNWKNLPNKWTESERKEKKEKKSHITWAEKKKNWERQLCYTWSRVEAWARDPVETESGSPAQVHSCWLLGKVRDAWACVCRC